MSLTGCTIAARIFRCLVLRFVVEKLESRRNLKRLSLNSVLVVFLYCKYVRTQRSAADHQTKIALHRFRASTHRLVIHPQQPQHLLLHLPLVRF